MPATISYANILHAVGQVLDQIGAKSIAIHEEEDGLVVEGFNSDGQLLVQMHYDIASLYELLKAQAGQPAAANTPVDDGVLHRFLAQYDRELVGSVL